MFLESMDNLQNDRIVVNRYGKGPSGVEYKTMSSLQFDEYGNLLKPGQKPAPEPEVRIIEQVKLTPRPVRNYNRPEPPVNYNGYYDSNSLPRQQSEVYQQYFQPQYNTLPTQNKFTRNQSLPVQSNFYPVAPAQPVIDPIRESSVVILENGQMNNYIVPNPDHIPRRQPQMYQQQVQQPYQQPFYQTPPVQKEPDMYQEQPPQNQNYQQQQIYQQEPGFQQQYNQPVQHQPVYQENQQQEQVFQQQYNRPVQQKPQQQPTRVTQPFLKNIQSANTMNNTKVGNGTGMQNGMKSYSVDMANPFGPKLSLKKPKQRYES